MKSKTLKNVSITTLVMSVMGWLVFAFFFAPDRFFSSTEPPIVPSTDPLSLLYFFFFIVGLAVPILSILGLAISTIFGIRERRKADGKHHWTPEQEGQSL
jgi:hypothetical protein